MTAIRYWNPTHDLLEASRTMDRLFDTFFGYGGTRVPDRGQDGELVTYHLPVDVLETPESYVLTASVPGFSPDQVEVTWHEGLLTIFARADREEPAGQWLRQERPHGNFLRRLQLPDGVRTDAIHAGFENGLLAIEVPKAPKPEPVKIPIGAAQNQISS